MNILFDFYRRLAVDMTTNDSSNAGDSSRSDNSRERLCDNYRVILPV